MKRFLVIGLLGVLVGGGLFFLNGTRPSGQVMQAENAAPHERAGLAPDFVLQDLQGQAVRLSDLRGKVVLVHFWATWCPPCRQEMPSMEALYRVLREVGVELLAINVDKEGARAVGPFLQQHPHSFPVLLDPDAVVQKAYRVDKFPETFVVDRQGVVVEHVIGAIDWSQPAVERFLRTL
ncbi:MAG: TlpA family protein disulfide reductase [Desulfuromonadaceae bacterium]|nr:TlpA family protein disulfide reductase [Desulfuromonadaceae bacterium]